MTSLIKIENELQGSFIVSILDNHWEHLNGHLFHIWKPRMFIHCIKHIYYWHLQRKLGLPSISLEDVLNHYRNKSGQ